MTITDYLMKMKGGAKSPPGVGAGELLGSAPRGQDITVIGENAAAIRKSGDH